MLLNFKCHRCNNSIKKLVESIDEIGILACLECGGFLERQIEGPNSSNVEVIDNGYMVKPVEFNRDLQEKRKQASNDVIKEKLKGLVPEE